MFDDDSVGFARDQVNKKLFSLMAQQYAEDHLDEFVQQLSQWVKIPTISPDPSKKEDVAQGAMYAQVRLEETGAETKIVETASNPVVLGKLDLNPYPHAPVMLVYNHGDVQPAEAEHWDTDPFTPTLREDLPGRPLFGRGATDDKGPALTVAYAARFMKEHGIPGPNLRFVWEFDEEIGSPHFGEALAKGKDFIGQPHSLFVTDTIGETTKDGIDVPTLTSRLRGVVSFVAEFGEGTDALHQGIYGGVVEDPLKVLIHAATSCEDTYGNVIIPDFYRDVPKITDHERKELEQTARMLSLETLRKDAKGARLVSDDLTTLFHNNWYRPLLTTHEFTGSAGTTIPGKASVRFTIRTVAGQDNQRVFECVRDHLRQFDPRITVNEPFMAPPAAISTDNAFADAAKDAFERGFGYRPLVIGSGGTIGIYGALRNAFGEIPEVDASLSMRRDNYHGHNESFETERFVPGVVAVADYFRRTADLR